MNIKNISTESLKKIFKPSFAFFAFTYLIRKLLFYIAYKGLPILDNDKFLLSLKNRHKGQRVFIIGTGSSLRLEDLEKLKDEITFSCNKIYLSFDQIDWRPTYYFAIDSLFLKQNYKNINKLNGFKKIFPWVAKFWCKGINNAHFYNLIWENLDWEKPYSKNPKFGLNPLKGLYFGSTVTYSMIQMAYYMGVREMYLLGIDFDYNVPKENEIGDIAFKEGSLNKNHFHSSYYEKEEMLYPPNLHRHKKSYLSAKEKMDELGAKIFNATRGGRLEIFPRVDFDSLFKTKT